MSSPTIFRSSGRTGEGSRHTRSFDMATTEERGRLHSIDVVRALAAMSVLVTHWAGWYAIPNGGRLAAAAAGWNATFLATFWAGHGIHPGVVVFIVLSGFCIHLPQARSRERVHQVGFWKHYARRRALRIAPVYWCAVMLGVWAAAAQIGSSELAPFSVDSSLSAGDVAGRLAFANAFRPWAALGNGPLDTVAAEILLYAKYPVVLFLVGRFGWWAAFAFSAMLQIAAVLCVALGIDGTWVSASVLTFDLYWVLGAFVAERYVQKQDNPSPMRLWRFSGMLIVYWIAARFLQFRGGHLLTTLLLAAAAGLAILDLTSATPRVPGLLGGALAWVGERSYSLYAVHTPVLFLVWIAFVSTFRHASSLLSVLQVAAVFAVTIVLYESVERPSHHVARRRGGIAPVAPLAQTGATVLDYRP
jgi:peptidoglycan/LPS O-acetylase OafA/YrhL